MMLGLEEQYGSVWDGFALAAGNQGERNAAHVDAAEALFGGITGRFLSAPEEGQ
ncbi:hypothetical protein [Streptomyces sp. NPDC008150]|uniref:hypothetical protein n=1 Tax=Streptomyces sp. NPDC008150 TaxID=3364816 RepID=UPI0036E4E93F